MALNVFFILLLQLYELDGDPKRKEFLDDLFNFMQKRGKCQSKWLYFIIPGLSYYLPFVAGNSNMHWNSDLYDSSF